MPLTDDDARKLAHAFVDALVSRLSTDTRVVAAPEPRYMRVVDFAARVGYSRTTVQSWIRAGMPALRAGRGHRVDVRAAEAWLTTMRPIVPREAVQ